MLIQTNKLGGGALAADVVMRTGTRLETEPPAEAEDAHAAVEAAMVEARRRVRLNEENIRRGLESTG